MTSPIPDDSMPVRVALIVAISVLGLAIVAMGAWAVFRPHPKAGPCAHLHARRGDLGRGRGHEFGGRHGHGLGRELRDHAAASGAAVVAEGAPPGSCARPRSPTDSAGRSTSRTRTVVRPAPSLRRPMGSTRSRRTALTLALARAGSVSLYEVETGRAHILGRGRGGPAGLAAGLLGGHVHASGRRTESRRSLRVSPAGGEELVVGTGSSVAVSPNGATVALLPAFGSTATPQVLLSATVRRFRLCPCQAATRSA